MSGLVKLLVLSVLGLFVGRLVAFSGPNFVIIFSIRVVRIFLGVKTRKRRKKA